MTNDQKTLALEIFEWMLARRAQKSAEQLADDAIKAFEVPASEQWIACDMARTAKATP